MLLVLNYGIDNIGDIYDYQGKFNDSRAALIANAFKPLEKYGWSFEDEELGLMEGTHELYEKETKADGE